jgi:hypothetical protein
LRLHQRGLLSFLFVKFLFVKPGTIHLHLHHHTHTVLAPRAGAGARGFAAFIQSSAGRMILERNGQLPTPMR